MQDGTPRDSNTICSDCGFQDRTSCTGTLSILRRGDLLAPFVDGKRLVITDKGKQALRIVIVARK